MKWHPANRQATLGLCAGAVAAPINVYGASRFEAPHETRSTSTRVMPMSLSSQSLIALKSRRALIAVRHSASQASSRVADARSRFSAKRRKAASRYNGAVTGWRLESQNVPNMVALLHTEQAKI